MSDLISTQPEFSLADATQLLWEKYGIQGDLQPLDSERDQNFLVSSPSNDHPFVLKIANSQTEAAQIGLENEAMSRLTQFSKSTISPQVNKSIDGRDIEFVFNGDQKHPVRLITFLKGRVLADFSPHSPRLLREFGELLGEVTKALSGFEHNGALRKFHWDLDHVKETLETHRNCVQDCSDIDFFLNRYLKTVFPLVADLRKSIIHNDANDHNVIVGFDGQSSDPNCALIDFGDMVFSSTVNELAIAIAYVMLGKPNPVESASYVVRGFCAEFELTDEELECVFDLACMRLCTSVVMAAYQRSLNPDNDYLSITDLPAQTTLKKLRAIHPDFASAYFRFACGRPPIPRAHSVVDFLRTNQKQQFPLLGFDLDVDNLHFFDFSVFGTGIHSEDLGSGNPDALFAEIAAKGKSIGIGRYAEPRLCYQGDQFLDANDFDCLPRTIHMGIDLFAKATTTIFAPLDGQIHSFQDNDCAFDYGPTIILKHQTAEGIAFYTLYGHLERSSLEGLTVGQTVEAGTPMATIGSQSENGGWAPHLHFQIMTHDLGYAGNYPGVVRSDELPLWRDIILDANLIVQIPDECFPVRPDDATKIQNDRDDFLNPSLSLSYQSPIHMVRGKQQFLFDANALAYLDCVNNVCHVGHCHPHVVDAAAQQLSMLNTNTRYLHSEITRYARRLTATLPDGLDVCFFVNSGSEANDLALRLARNFTQKQEVICVDGAYHGNLTSLIEISPYKFDSPGGKGKPDHVHRIPLPDSFRGQHNSLKQAPHSLGEYYARFVQDAMEDSRKQSETGSANVAAFICESILSCGGQIVLPEGYLSAIYKTLRCENVLCIADEVQVGFGRVGSHFWGFELQKVCPDIVTMGKPIGNGFPLAAVVTTRKIADAFDNGMEYFNTYGGNPVSSAVGNAVLDVIASEELQTNASEVGSYFLEKLNSVKKRFSSIGDVRGKGLFLGIEFVRDSQMTPNPELAKYIVERMKQNRILLSTDGPQNNVIKIKPPLVFDKSNVDRVVETLEKLLCESYPLGFEPKEA